MNVPVFLYSLLFTVWFLTAAYPAAADAQDTRSSEAVQLQENLNSQGYWCGPVDGLLSSRSYQEVARFQIATRLVADGMVGIRTRKLPGLDSIIASSEKMPTASADSSVYKMNASSILEGSNAASNSSSKPVSQSSNVSRGKRVLTMVATGYDGCYECNKPFYGKPSYIGLPLKRGIVAVDPRVIPMGTRLYVEGYGEAIAADQGNAIKGNRIDLFFDTHQQGLDWGIKTVKVTILS